LTAEAPSGHIGGMTLGYDYPLLGVFWSMFWFFLWVLWFILLFRIIVDIFRSHDMGGFVKALWLLFVILTPFLGVFVYVIARGHKMAEHAMDDAKAQDAAMRSYVQQVTASGASPADEISKLAALRDAGSITAAEFEAGKAKILS
jgi:type VI protein secretion system component VasK